MYYVKSKIINQKNFKFGLKFGYEVEFGLKFGYEVEFNFEFK